MKNESELLTPAQVARAFAVDAKTVTRWAKSGKLRWIRLPSGHRRYYRTEVERLGGIVNHRTRKEERHG